MKVVAHAKGFWGQVREVDDEFDVPHSASGSWFSPVGDDDEPVEPVAVKAPAVKPKGKAKAEDNEPI